MTTPAAARATHDAGAELRMSIFTRRYGAAVVLASIAGAVDAIGFLHFHTFYVSFMSGNTTRMAVAVANGDLGVVMGGGAVIASFVAGVVVGDLLTNEPPRRQWATLLFEAALLLFAALFGPGIRSSLLLAAAMGMHNALVLRADGATVALTYVTGTLVHVGRAVAARFAERRSPPALWPMVGLWLALASGAIACGSILGEEAAITAIATLLAVTALAIVSKPDLLRGSA